MDWDLTSYFKTFGDEAFVAFKESLAAETSAINILLTQLMEPAVSDLEALTTSIERFEALTANISHLSSYISCLVAGDASNEEWAAEEANLSQISAASTKLQNKLMILVGRLDEEAFARLAQLESLNGCSYALQRLRTLSKQRMSLAEEELAADLGVNGISAWSRLYFNTVSNLRFTYDHPEKGPTTAPLSQLNSLLASPDRALRKAASVGSAKVLKENQQIFSAALNSISGTRLELNKRRRIEHFLEPGLFQSGIEKETLDALMGAIEKKVDFARDVFRFRNQAMKIQDPGWVDLRAALPLDGANPNWSEGVQLVSKAFNASYPDMGRFFDEMIDKQWIDHSPRASKRPGGFCTTSRLSGESRIFMNYEDTLNDVMTLAHEAGHAWHSRILKNTRPMANSYPMTLAETASTFAERILTKGILSDPETDDLTQLVLLDAEIEHMLAFLLDLPVRFRFEEAVYSKRPTSTLSASELCKLMADTQHRFFGDTFSEDSPDPWFWASKMHFYIASVQFYNYPYVFGYLLSQAFLEAMRMDHGKGISAFERFLEFSGRRSCEALIMETLNEDITQEAFWGRMIDGLGENFSRYQALLNRILPQ